MVNPPQGVQSEPAGQLGWEHGDSLRSLSFFPQKTLPLHTQIKNTHNDSSQAFSQRRTDLLEQAFLLFLSE